MMMERRELKPKLPPKKDDWSADSKSQLSLGLGSAEYNEYVKDRHLSSPGEGTNIQAKDLRAMPKDHRREVEDVLAKHVTASAQIQTNGTYAKGIQSGNVTKQEQDRDLLIRRRAYTQRKKEDLDDDATRAATRHAQETATKSDDKAVKRALPKTLENLKYNDGVTEDEYLPKALQNYL